MILNVVECVNCHKKFAALPAWIRILHKFNQTYVVDTDDTTVYTFDPQKHYSCRIVAARKHTTPIVHVEKAHAWSGAFILFVDTYESLYDFTRFLMEWVVFSTFVYLFWHFAWIGFVLCYIFSPDLFWSYVVICIFSWSGYYLGDGGPQWLQYPNMQFSDVLISIGLNMGKAFFLMRTYNIINTFLCDSVEEMDARQARLMLNRTGIPRYLLNSMFILLFLAFVATYLPLFSSYVPFFNIMHDFTNVSIMIAAISWLAMLWLPARYKWIPIQIEQPKIDLDWKKWNLWKPKSKDNV
jgi:hypothetical protein